MQHGFPNRGASIPEPVLIVVFSWAKTVPECFNDRWKWISHESVRDFLFAICQVGMDFRKTGTAGDTRVHSEFTNQKIQRLYSWTLDIRILLQYSRAFSPNVDQGTQQHRSTKRGNIGAMRLKVKRNLDPSYVKQDDSACLLHISITVSKRFTDVSADSPLQDRLQKKLDMASVHLKIVFKIQGYSCEFVIMWKKTSFLGKKLPATIQIDKNHKCIASWRHFSGLEVKEELHECRELPRNWPMRDRGHQPERPWPGCCCWLINMPELPKVDLRNSRAQETSVLVHFQWYPNRPYNSIYNSIKYCTSMLRSILQPMCTQHVSISGQKGKISLVPQKLWPGFFKPLSAPLWAAYKMMPPMNHIQPTGQVVCSLIKSSHTFVKGLAPDVWAAPWEQLAAKRPSVSFAAIARKQCQESAPAPGNIELAQQINGVQQPYTVYKHFQWHSAWDYTLNKVAHCIHLRIHLLVRAQPHCIWCLVWDIDMREPNCPNA